MPDDTTQTEGEAEGVVTEDETPQPEPSDGQELRDDAERLAKMGFRLVRGAWRRG